MKSIDKITFVLISIGVIFNAVKTYFYQANLEFILFEQVFGWYFKIAFYGNVLITIAAVISFILYKKYFPAYVSFCYVGLILCTIIASLNDFTSILKAPTTLYTTKGIGTFINIGILFFAANTTYFPKLLKLFYYLCFAFIIAGIVNLGKVGFESGRDQYLYAIREFTVYLIWVFPYFFLQDSTDKKANILNIFIFLVIFIFVLSTGSRSYIIIYILFFIVKFRHQLQGKNAMMAIAGMVVLIAGAVFLLANTGLSKTIEGAFTILSERSSEDSRSGQIIEFLDQYDLNYLLQGVGPKQTWYWSTIGRQYDFLDNQFLLLAWWAGLPALLLYVYLLVKSFFTKSEILVFEEVKGVRLIIALWILACLGFAIYVTISSDLYYYFISLLMGLHLCKFTDIYTTDIEEA